MKLFRRNTLFHTEKNAPDPEELKFRFRRRIFILAILGAIGFLGLPVCRDLRDVLAARDDARRFSQLLADARWRAMHNRSCVSLEFRPESKEWILREHLGKTTCDSAVTNEFSTNFQGSSQWQFASVVDNKLCFSPQLGLITDSTPRANAVSLKILAVSKAEGAEIQLDPHLFQIEIQNL